MQNFTLGKKGISMLFFAFFLLTTSFSSFAQENCPTAATPQDFCYLATVSDLQATANGDTVRWYRTATSTNPIPEDELLQTETYYAGNASGSCTNRIPVSVTIDDIGAPDPAFGSIFSPCVYGPEPAPGDPDPVYIKTVQDLINNISGNDVEIFDNEFDEVKLDESTALVRGENYFAGQTNSNTGCTTSRVSIRYDPIYTPAPAADPLQIVCEGATIADLVATGTTPLSQGFRWYSTMDSQPALANSTVLINGEDYYVSQIVNRIGRDEPPCESTDRVMVTVTVEPTALNESVQRFCESISRENVEFDVPRVLDLSPEGATWFATATSTEALDPQTELEDSEDYFNRDNGSECSQDRVVAEFFPTPNAGSTTSVTVCSNDDEFNLVDEINNSIIGPPQQTGRFSPELSTGTLMFDPADYEPGSYTFRYIVEGNEDCPTDESRITVVVEEAPNAGEDVDETICSSEINDAIEFAQQYASYLENRDLSGTFDNNATTEVETFSLQELAVALAGQYQATPFIPFSYTYTVGEEGDCQDSAQINLTILDSPDAGEDAVVNLEEEGTDPINLFDRLGGDPDAGGTWSNGSGIFDPETDTPGDFVYTLPPNNNGCADSATVSVVPSQEECPVVEATTQSFCESISDANGNNPRRPRVNDLTPSGATWYATADSEEPLPGNTILTDGTTYYAGNSGGTCESRTPVLVNIDDSPNAGRTTNITVCGADEPFDLLDRYNPSVLGAPDAGGTITPALASGTTIFDPSVDAARQYTYRVESTNSACPDDTSRITVNITEPTNANAGEDVEESFCSNDGTIDLYSLIPDGVNTSGVFEGFENGQFDTSENIGENEITYTVDDEEGCVIAGSATYFITVFEAPNAGPGADLNFCITEIQEMSQEEAIAIFENLIPDDVTEGGEFSTSINDLIIEFSANPIGEFSTTYTVSNENCTDSATYSVTISEAEAADAGSDVDDLVFCSTDADVNLFDLLSEDAQQNGYFEELENGVFSPSTAGVGTFNFTFTVDSSSDCVTESDSAIYTIEVLQGPDAGENGSVTLSTSDEPVNLFAYLNGTPEEGGLWNPGNSDGSFDPSQFEEGQFEFTYTVVSENECEASATVTVTITDDEIICPIVTDTEQAFCESIEAGNDSRLPRVSDLMPSNATWYATADSDEPLAANAVLIDGEDYFAGNEDGTCTTRERVVVTLDDSPNAGRTTNITVCSDDEPFDLLGRINPSILGTPDAGGTFTPALASGTTIFDPSVDAARQYTYTVQSTNEACPDDDTRVTVNILQSEAANAGDDRDDIVFCVNDGDVQLSEFLLNAMAGGLFTGDGVTNGMFSPSTTGAGDFTVTYTVTDEANCVIEGSSDIATFEITVLEPAEANTGGNQTPDAYCVTDDQDKALIPLLEDGANPFGTFTIDGEEITSFNPAQLGIGEFVITYSIDENDCAIGSDSATITITVVEQPDAPVADANQAFCLIDNPTVADIVATGDNVVIYVDEALEVEADGTTPLADLAVYYAASTTNGCKSEGVMIKISLTNGTVPTLQTDGDEFCRSDNPTVQDLINNLSGSGIKIYQASTGGIALATSTALVDGTTYFASGTDTVGCESSERRPLQVEVAFCGIPEAFSPNEDNINDRFVIPDIATDYPNYNIEIFNRWGNVVFKGNSSTGDWDGVSNQSGTLGDNVLAAGVYFYILNYNDGQTAPIQGKVYLSR